MAGYKGTGVVFLKGSVSNAGPDKEQALQTLLNEKEKTIWKNALAFQWIPMEIANKFWTYCSQVLYPDKSSDDALYLLGIDMAKNDINKVYRMIFKLINSDIIIKKSASLWRTYNQAGDCSVEKTSPCESFYDVVNYPDLPAEFAQATCGYIHGLMEMTGKKNIRIVKYRLDTGWRWHISYQLS